MSRDLLMILAVEIPTCEGDIEGIQASDVCCPASCGECGGSGCSARDGGGLFSGREACCGSGVRSLNRVCSDTVGAPCVVPEGKFMYVARFFYRIVDRWSCCLSCLLRPTRGDSKSSKFAHVLQHSHQGVSPIFQTFGNRKTVSSMLSEARQ